MKKAFFSGYGFFYLVRSLVDPSTEGTPYKKEYANFRNEHKENPFKLQGRISRRYMIWK